MKIVVSLLLLSTLLMGSISGMQKRGTKKPAGEPVLARKIARFAPTILTADLSNLAARDRQALSKIIAAAKLLDPLFLRQAWSGNEALKTKLEADKDYGRPSTSALFFD